ncbi:hypothetical protein J010_03220 [Cryptococcus neoformans]|nr:hypothetical protein C355_02842 [Cryptococcus neoformans var. grubii Th84]OXH10915.1 hypothetical protein J010_03220 [Cryptococcus neoformans var. grubii]OXH31714.1 hypothetical protein J009_03234 [Cryptococcus neoformans var. grubii]OXH55237.1 hypothetical protein J002_03195 [Cryptococcus neoformans var. grubii]OXH70151.1 hypothetical protein J001_03254 [Cryptococcus neoformans var. grubii]
MPRGRWQEWLVGSRNDASCFASSHFDPDVSTLKASAYLRRRWMFVTSGHAMAGGLLPWKG